MITITINKNILETMSLDDVNYWIELQIGSEYEIEWTN